MNSICTSLEQSKKLMELGIDINTAGMWWAERYRGHTTKDYQYIVDNTPYYYLSLTKPSDDNYSQDTIKDISAWGFSALLSLMPFHIIENNQRYAFSMHKGSNRNGETYIFRYNIFNTDICLYSTGYYNNPIDAAFEMVVWLKENKKI